MCRAALAAALLLVVLISGACAERTQHVSLSAVVVDRWMERPRQLGGEETWLVAFRVADQGVYALVVEAVKPETWDALPAGRKVTLVGTRGRGGKLGARMAIVFDSGDKRPPQSDA
jgi:hypothetical protein